LGVSLNERVADAIWGGTEPTKWTRILTAQTSLRWGDLCLAPCPHSTPAERALVLLRGSAPDMGGPVREHEGGEARDWAALPALWRKLDTEADQRRGLLRCALRRIAQKVVTSTCITCIRDSCIKGPCRATRSVPLRSAVQLWCAHVRL